MISPALTAASQPKAAISFFERKLTVWVALYIVVGIALGQLLPGVFQAVARLEVAQVNVPVGVLIWVMIIPMLLKIDFGALGHPSRRLRADRHRIPEDAALEGEGSWWRAWASPCANCCARRERPMPNSA